jgi:hypothetical protein
MSLGGLRWGRIALLFKSGFDRLLFAASKKKPCFSNPKKIFKCMTFYEEAQLLSISLPTRPLDKLV